MSQRYEYDVSIIIISHNHERYLEECLESIYQKTKKITFEIILIDNIPKGECAAIVKNKYPKVKLINNENILGFSSNNNIGIKISKGEYICILNPDTKLKNNAIEILYNFLVEKRNVGTAGPKIYFPNGELQYSCRKFPTFKSFILRRTPFRNLLIENKRDVNHLMNNWNHNSTRSVDWLLGACLMVKKGRIINIGLFDEKYELYCEDIDLCYSLKKANFNNYYINKAEIYHYHQKESDNKFLSKRTYIHFKSMFYFIKKQKYMLNLFNG